MKRIDGRGAGWLTLVAVFVASVAWAEDGAPGDALPPDAKAAFDRGVRAVEAQDWSLATRYFTEARKAAPGAPAVALNLGLAYAKAGEEPLAIAWLNAFADADPQSPKAVAARTEAQRLQGEATKKLKMLYETAVAALGQKEGDKSSELAYLAESAAKAGLLDEALALAARPAVAENSYYKAKAPAVALIGYAESLCNAGDPRRAAEALVRVPTIWPEATGDISYDFAWQRVSERFCEQKDLDRAWRAAKQIGKRDERGQTMAEVAKLRAAEGDLVPAEEVLPLLQPGLYRDWLLESMAHAQLRRKEEGPAYYTARSLHSSYARGALLVNFAQRRVAAGNQDGARALVREVLGFGRAADIEASFNATQGISIDTAFQCYLLLGDYANAYQMAAQQDQRNPYVPYQPYASFAELIYHQAVEGKDLNGAIRTAKKALARPAATDSGVVATGPAIIYAALAAAQAKLGRSGDVIASLRVPQKNRVFVLRRLTPTVEALIAQNRLDRAVEILRFTGEIRADPEMSNPGDQEWLDQMRAMPSAQVAAAQVVAGNYGVAEKTAEGILAAQYRPVVYLAMADAAMARNARPDALRALQSAATVIRGSRPNETIRVPESWKLDRSPTMGEALRRIAEMQTTLGDVAAAQVTSAVRPTMGGPWLELADHYSFRDSVSIAKALDETREMKSPGEIIRKLCDAGKKYGEKLVRIQVLTEQLVVRKR